MGTNSETNKQTKLAAKKKCKSTIEQNGIANS